MNSRFNSRVKNTLETNKSERKSKSECEVFSRRFRSHSHRFSSETYVKEDPLFPKIP